MAIASRLLHIRLHVGAPAFAQAPVLGVFAALSTLALVVVGCSNPPPNNNASPFFVPSGSDTGLSTDLGLHNQTDAAHTDTGGVAPDGDAAGTGAADTGADVVQLTGEPCAKATACKAFKDTPYCQLSAQVCVQCLTDFHCLKTTKNCDLTTYTCKEESCVPGTTTCEGNFLATCKADGKGFDVTSCPDDKPVCAAGGCHLCQPSQKFCAKPAISGQPSKQVMQCDGSGDVAGVVQQCTGDQVCHNSVCGVCVPGAKRCGGQTAEVCKPDGSGWKTLDDCPSKGLTCLGGLCVNPCASDFKSGTNVGCDYWAVDLDNAIEKAGSKVLDAQNGQFAVIVSNTSTSPAQVSVTIGPDKKAPGAKTKTWSVPAKGLQVINLPDKTWGVPNQNQDGSSINGRVYRIQSSQPIVAYQFNPLSNQGVFSNDASLLLPTGSIGKEYWIVSRAQLGNKYRSYFNVVAAMPGTTKVTVVASAPTIAGVGVPSMSLGGQKVFSLKQGQVLNVESNKEGADLTGSWVKADKEVVVFGGSEASSSPNIGNCIKNPNSLLGGKVCAGTSSSINPIGKPCTADSQCPASCCADHLEEQLFPVKAWGTTYVAARLSPRGKERDAWRIVAKENGTKVTLQPNIGVNVPTLNQGQFYEFESTADFIVQANKPILVAQYMASSYASSTQENPPCNSDSDCKSKYGFLGRCVSAGFSKICRPIGDPSLILDVATSQYLKNYIFLVPTKYKINYLTVIAAKGAKVVLDGGTLAPSGFKSVGNSSWVVTRLPVSPGKHQLTSDKPMGLFVYGYDAAVSYGYPGGAGL